MNVWRETSTLVSVRCDDGKAVMYLSVEGAAALMEGLETALSASPRFASSSLAPIIPITPMTKGQWSRPAPPAPPRHARCPRPRVASPCAPTASPRRATGDARRQRLWTHGARRRRPGKVAGVSSTATTSAPPNHLGGRTAPKLDLGAVRLYRSPAPLHE